MIFHYVLISFYSGQHWLWHQDDHPEEHGKTQKELFWSSSDKNLHSDEKGLLPQVPDLWHLSASHQEERPWSNHVSQKVTVLCVQRERRGHDWAHGLVVIRPLVWQPSLWNSVTDDYIGDNLWFAAELLQCVVWRLIMHKFASAACIIFI